MNFFLVIKIMFDFSEGKILQDYLIPDISGIIISYLTGPIQKFTKDFINECVENGDYLYYRDAHDQRKLVYESLINYMLHYKYYDKVHKLLLNCKNINISHFQNMNYKYRTELYILCSKKKWDTIMLMPNLDVKYFLNNDRWKTNELGNLCKQGNNIVLNNIKNLKMKHIIPSKFNLQTNLFGSVIIHNIQIVTKIPDLTYDHFRIDLHNGRTGMNYMFEFTNRQYKNYIIEIVKKFKFTAEDYMSKCGIYKKTALFILCQKNYIEIIKLIPNLLPKHFTNKSLNEDTELYQLCKRKRKDILLMLSTKFVWKLEHCGSDMEINYLKSINIL